MRCTPGNVVFLTHRHFIVTGRHLDLPCRIHAGLEGVELFLYNRTPAYDEIIRQLGEDNDVFGQPNDTTNGARGFSLDDPVVDKNTRATVITHSSELFKAFLSPSGSNENTAARPRGAMASLESFSRGLKAAGDWIKGLVPTFNITDVLPLSFDAAQCAIVAGNDSTPSVLIGEVIKLNGTYGLTNVSGTWVLVVAWEVLIPRPLSHGPSSICTRMFIP